MEGLIAMINTALIDCKNAVNKIKIVATFGGNISEMRSSLITMSEASCNMVSGLADLMGREIPDLSALNDTARDFIAVADFSSEEEVKSMEEYFDILANTVTKMVA